MKRVLYLKTKVLVVAIVCLLPLLVLFNAGLNMLNGRSSGVFASASSGGPYEIRSRLLMEAMQQIGVCDAQKAAESWAKGVKQRSGALQYAVMSENLKGKYAEALQTTAPNWVTGVSSPWVDSFTVEKQEVSDQNHAQFNVQFKLASSAGPAGSLKAALTVIKEGDFFVVDDIAGDEGLKAYTGFGNTAAKDSSIELTITQ